MEIGFNFIYIILIALFVYLKYQFLPFILGFLLSTLFKEESTAMQAGVGSFYPLMMLSGILWPIEGNINEYENYLVNLKFKIS